jgi:hypothetical protein
MHNLIHHSYCLNLTIQNDKDFKISNKILTFPSHYQGYINLPAYLDSHLPPEKKKLTSHWEIKHMMINVLQPRKYKSIYMEAKEKSEKVQVCAYTKRLTKWVKILYRTEALVSASV